MEATDPDLVELLLPDLDELEAWLATPEASETRGLRLRMAYPPAVVLLERLGAASLPALRRLELDGCALGDDGLDVLMRGGLLARLTALAIVDETISDEAVEALLACEHFTRLEHLRLELGRSATQRLVACPRLGGLRLLGLSEYLEDESLARLLDNSLQPEALAPWRALAASRVEAQLQRTPYHRRWEEETGPLLAALVELERPVPQDRGAGPHAPVPGDMSSSAAALAELARARWPAIDRPALSAWLDRALRGHAPALRLAGTLRLYHLRGVRRTAEDLDALTALLAHPDGVHLRRVDLSYLSLDEPTLARWLAGPWLAGVFALDLHGHRLGAAALAALTGNPAAASLRALHLGGSLAEPGDLRRLLASPGTAQLHALELSNNHLDADSLRALATSPALVGLQGLELRGCGLGDLGPLAGARWPALRRLILTENPLGDAAAQTVAGLPLPALTRLDLGYPRDGAAITDVGARALAEAVSWVRLEDLGLGFHAIGDAGALALVGARRMPALHRLQICHGNAITRAGALALVDAAAPRLRLDVSEVCNAAFRDSPEVRASSLAMPEGPAPRDPADPPP